MFTVEQIEQAHARVKSGADFPQYIRDIKQLGVKAFETRVQDSVTLYWGANGYSTQSSPQYDKLAIASESDKTKFSQYLKLHQQGKTDYYTFCTHCAEAGVEKWVVRFDEMSCTYYDAKGNEMLMESIPQ